MEKLIEYGLEINRCRSWKIQVDNLIFAITCLPPFPFEQGAQGKLFSF